MKPAPGHWRDVGITVSKLYMFSRKIRGTERSGDIADGNLDHIKYSTVYHLVRPWVLHGAAIKFTVLYCTVKYSTVQYSNILHSTLDFGHGTVTYFLSEIVLLYCSMYCISILLQYSTVHKTVQNYCTVLYFFLGSLCSEPAVSCI